MQQLAAALGVSDQAQPGQQWQSTANLQHTGVVKHWSDDKGFGFVTVEGFPSDVYAHRTTFADGEALVVGATVSLNAEQDASSGKYKATALSGAVAKGSGKSSGAGGCQKGSIGNGGGWGTDKGGDWGMDKGKGCKGKGKDWGCGCKGWGADSWGGKGWGGGCGWDDWSGGGKNGYACDSWGGGWGGGKGKGVGKGKGKGEYMPMQQAWVRSWHDDKGFGFAVLADGSDIYVHRSVLQDGHCLVVDKEVWCDAVYSYEKGNWAALALTGASPPGEGGGVMKGGGKGRNKNAGREDPAALGMQGGTVKAWVPKGFGFLIPDNGGPDVFVHKDSLGGMDGLEIGAKVSFDLQWDDARQKYLATSCFYSDGMPSSQAASADGGYGAALGHGVGDARAVPYDGAAGGWGGAEEGSAAATAGTPQQDMSQAWQGMMMQQ